MVHSSCYVDLDKLGGALGRPLTAEEKDALGKEVDNIINNAKLADNIGDLNAAVAAGVEGLGNDLKLAAAIERRNALLNTKAKLQAVDYITNVWGDAPGKGLTAYLGGVSSARQGSRASVAASQQALTNRYVQGFISDLLKNDIHKVFVSGDLDREVYEAMSRLGEKEPKFDDLPVEAVKIAQTIEKWNEVSRLDANSVGAFIKKLPGRVVKQTHDLYKIRSAGWDKWKEFVTERLDWDKSFPDVPVEKRESVLKDLYTQFAAGVHVKLGDNPVAGFKGFANIGKRMSQDRVMQWKTPEMEYQYAQAFGAGPLREAMLHGLEKSANDTAIMRHLGPNAEANLDGVITQVKQKLRAAGDPVALEKFQKDADNLKATLWPNITGAARIPGDHMLAQVSAGVRSWQQWAKLGGALIGSFNDIAVYGSEVRYQGGSMLGGIGEAIGGLVKGKPSNEATEILSMLSVFQDGMRAATASRHDTLDGLPGAVAKTNQLFFKLNGLRWWTDRLRAQFGLGLSHRLALKAGEKWEGLGEDLTRTLGLYGLDEGKWDIIRQAPQNAADGRPYLTPEGLKGVDDAEFSKYIAGKGLTPTPAKIKALRSEIEDQFRSYFADRANIGVVEPDVRTRAITLRGTRPGTPEGEFARHIMLFKSFPASILQKVLAREVYGRSTETTFWKAMRSGNGEMMGVANLIAYSMMFGYGSMVTKDLLKGRTPRQPNDYKTWMAALAQGGGLGIYGDFLFGEMKNRFGGTPLNTLMGPTAGSASDLLDLYQRVRDGDDAAASGVRFLVNNGPFMNLFYTKAALDYLILYRISEHMNPGYLSRMENRIEKQNGQTFLVPPSQVIPRGGGF